MTNTQHAARRNHPPLEFNAQALIAYGWKPSWHIHGSLYSGGIGFAHATWRQPTDATERTSPQSCVATSRFN
jgi:hypothetical protein